MLPLVASNLKNLPLCWRLLNPHFIGSLNFYSSLSLHQLNLGCDEAGVGCVELFLDGILQLGYVYVFGGANDAPKVGLNFESLVCVLVSVFHGCLPCAVGQFVSFFVVVDAFLAVAVLWTFSIRARTIRSFTRHKRIRNSYSIYSLSRFGKNYRNTLR